ncbi:uncharacterized protein EV420DRAFT_1488283 [Desarmillaria tabescens]|uniref:Uncharacterized protein n=1 Tax=Armillaria tabescens TaxID=1929756 RepID=A0AA39MIT1_ARMTA|nr:uncharacterized protein EV420DRAFT_1488283 [Desarmillaria tabescens]KAK0435005.1 hypothetical protein EV420DRAFT_1488283 [Desarmillaria tabescens]
MTTNSPPLDLSTIILTSAGMSLVCSRLQEEAKAEPGMILKVGRLYSTQAFDPAYILIPCFKPNTRRRTIKDFDTEMYVHDMYKPLYVSNTMGYHMIALKEYPKLVLHFFYCLLQLVMGVVKHNNKKNHTLSVPLSVKTSWYGNFLIIVTNGKNPVDFEQTKSFANVVDGIVKKFVIDYVGEWEAMKKATNYKMIRNKAAPTFLSLYR